jgi:hypothetical protein
MIFFIAPIIFLGVFISIGIIFSNLTNKPETKDYDYTINFGIENGDYTREYIDNLKYEEVNISSEFGYKLFGKFFERPGSKKAIVLVHGYTWTHAGTIKYLDMFRKKEYNVLLFDNRYHGLSGGKFTSFGFFEKYDLKTCVNWLFEKLGKNTKIGVMGESLGGGTVIQYSAIDNRASFVIADCPYSDLKKQLGYRLKKDYKLPYFLVIPITSLISKIKFKFFFGEVSPIKDIKNNAVPTLLIHGKKDDFVPTSMSIELYNAKNIGKKALYLADDAKHVGSFATNKKEYEKTIYNFLEKNNL